MKKNYDLIGIGIGPFNLSLSALLTKTNHFQYQFYERNKNINWHSGMLLKNSILQVSYLKDLVTLVDPTNPWSFLAYLSHCGHIYQFLNRKSSIVSRIEYERYYQWAARTLPNLSFEKEVYSIDYLPRQKKFSLKLNNEEVCSKHLSIGVGHAPHIPEMFSHYLSSRVFHASLYKQSISSLDLFNKNVIVIGGGQSGAEIIHDLLDKQGTLGSLTWVSRRLNFLPMEDACFTNEFYTPSYVNYFFELSDIAKKNNLKQQKISCNGISEALANDVYRKIYTAKYVECSPTLIRLYPNHSIKRVESVNSNYKVQIYSNDTQSRQALSADIVILATGYNERIPGCLSSFVDRYKDRNDPTLRFNKDYSLRWQHQATNKIFFQNFNLQSHGISDPNLSLAAWRNATIINSLLGKSIYYLKQYSLFEHVENRYNARNSDSNMTSCN